MKLVRTKGTVFFQTLTSKLWQWIVKIKDCTVKIFKYSLGLLKFAKHKWQISMLLAKEMSRREVLKLESFAFTCDPSYDVIPPIISYAL